MKTDIDWSVFDTYPESNCECNCGATFRSHAKFVMSPAHTEARKPCPLCGQTDNVRTARSDVETWVFGRITR